MWTRFASHACGIVLAVLLAPIAAHAAATIEFLDSPSEWTTAEKEVVFYIKATGGTVADVHCWINVLTTERGQPAPRNSFACTVPALVNPGVVAQVSVKLSPDAGLKIGTYSAVLQILGLDPSGASVSQSSAFKAIVPAVTLKIGETDSIRIRLIRQWPLSPATATIPIGIRVTSDLSPKRIPKAVATQLYVQDGDAKDIVPDGELSAYFCTPNAEAIPSPHTIDPRIGKTPAVPCSKITSAASDSETRGLEGQGLHVTLAVPADVQKATGVLRLRSPEFASDLDTPVVVLVKDWWPFAALVVFLGQLLSFWVNNWVTIGRQNKLNQLEVAPIESSLLGLLKSRPDLESRPEIAAVMTLLDSAAQANKLGEVESAKTYISKAKEKLDQFTANIPPAQTGSSASPSIVMLQKSRAYPARRLNFVITNVDPGWKGNSLYKWEWSGQRSTLKEFITQTDQRGIRKLSKDYLDKQQWRLLYEAQDLRTISPIFWKTGQYTLRVSVDAAQAAALPFRLDNDPSLSFLSRIAASDKAVLLLAVAFAAILSYLTIDKLETFGSVSDYALAFLGGFGLNATTSGFGAVISRFKGGTS